MWKILVEHLAKIISTLKHENYKTIDIEEATNTYFQTVPKNLFKSITFDCKKELSNWNS